MALLIPQSTPKKKGLLQPIKDNSVLGVAKNTLLGLPKAATDLAGGAAKQTGKGLGLLINSISLDADKVPAIKTRSGRELPKIDPTGFIGSIGKAPALATKAAQKVVSNAGLVRPASQVGKQTLQGIQGTSRPLLAKPVVSPKSVATSGLPPRPPSKPSLPASVPDPFDPGKYVKEQVTKREGARAGSKPGLLSMGKSFLKDAKAKLVDSTSPIEDVLYETVKKNKLTLKPSEDIHNQIDRVLRAPTLAGQFAKDHGLAQIIKKVDDPDMLDQYLIAKHARTLEGRGVKTGRDLVKDSALVETVAPKYEQQAKVVSDYSKKLLDYSVDNGLVSRKLADELRTRHPEYVPFNRVFSEIEKAEGYGSKAVASLSKQTAVQKITGSEREIESPLRSLLTKTNDVFKQGEKNAAARLLASYEKLPGNPFQLRELKAGESAPHTISYFDDGVKKTFETAPEIAQAAKSLNVQQLNILGNILAAPVRIARLGMTGINVPFVATNIVRDQITAFINSDRALASSIANPKNFVSALFSAVSHNKLYDEVVRAGGMGTTFDLSRSQVDQTFEGIRAGRNIGSRIKHTVKNPGELLRAAENIVGRAEELTRIQQYRAAKLDLLKKGFSPKDAEMGAARAARDTTVNFARRGEWGTVLNSAFLYLNASIQGTRTFLRAAKTKPVATATKVAVSTLFPAASITAWNLNDPARRAAYEDISEYEKRNNIVIIPPNPTKDDEGAWDVIKIPLSQEVNDLVGMVRRPIEQAYGLDPVKFGDIYNALMGTVSPIGPEPREALNSLIPQAVKPSIESMTNTSLFTDRPIVPMGKQNLSPEEQVQPWTSGTARQFGKLVGASPIKIEAFTKSTLGGVGSQILNASDQALAAGGVIPKEQIGGQSITDSLTARFSKARGGEIENKSYEKMDAIDREKADYKAKNVRPVYDQAQALKAEGRLAEADALWQALSEKDKEIYKDIKTAEKSKATKEQERQLLPLYERLQQMKAEGREGEANEIYYNLSEEERHAYSLLKKKFQK